jgi:hypothetical protein
LRPFANSAVNRHAADLHIFTEINGRLVDLLSQLPGGGQHEDTHAPQGPAGQSLQDRQHEGGGLAGPGLRHAQHVIPPQNNRDRLLLDGGGVRKPDPCNTRLNARVE